MAPKLYTPPIAILRSVFHTCLFGSQNFIARSDHSQALIVLLDDTNNLSTTSLVICILGSTRALCGLSDLHSCRISIEIRRRLQSSVSIQNQYNTFEATLSNHAASCQPPSVELGGGIRCSGVEVIPSRCLELALLDS